MPPNAPIVQFQKQQKETTLDKIIKGLSVANQLTGTVANVSQLGAQNRLVEAQTKLAEAKAENVGVTDPKTEAVLANIADQMRDRGVKQDIAQQNLELNRSRVTGVLPSSNNNRGVLESGQSQGVFAQPVSTTTQQPGGTSAPPQDRRSAIMQIANQLSGGKLARLTPQARNQALDRATKEYEAGIKDQEKLDKEETKAQQEEQTADVVVDTIKDIKNIVKDSTLPTTGTGGKLIRMTGIEEFGASKVTNLLDTVKAQVGFANLLKIKQAGGTLGALSERENELLQAMEGALKENLPKEQFLKALDRVQLKYQAVLDERQSAAGAGSSTAGPAEGAVPNTNIKPDARNNILEAGSPSPGSVVRVNGKQYKVAEDGDTLIEIK